MKVSIIIPYNIDRGYLHEAVESCQNQTGFILNEDFEVILSQGNQTLGRNVNAGLKQAKGKYIKICAEDDMLTPDCLLYLYNTAEAGAYDFLCANAVNIDDYSKESQLIRSIIPNTISELADTNTIHGGTILYRREVMPLWNEHLESAEEYEVTLRMADAGARFGYVDAVVYKYRIWSQQKGNTNNRTSEHYEQRENMIEPYYWSRKRINKY